MKFITKTYLMLLVSTFTFFGLSAIQSLSYFTNFLGEQRITINVAAQEEENETSNNEVKEAKEAFEKQAENFLEIQYSARHLTAFHRYFHKWDFDFIEVATPPPEYIA